MSISGLSTIFVYPPYNNLHLTGCPEVNARIGLNDASYKINTLQFADNTCEVESGSVVTLENQNKSTTVWESKDHQFIQ